MKWTWKRFQRRHKIISMKKTQAMLGFSTERIIWITTKSRKVFVATRGEPWLTLNWDTTVPVIDEISLNVAVILTEEGVNLRNEDLLN